MLSNQKSNQHCEQENSGESTTLPLMNQELNQNIFKRSSQQSNIYTKNRSKTFTHLSEDNLNLKWEKLFNLINNSDKELRPIKDKDIIKIFTNEENYQDESLKKVGTFVQDDSQTCVAWFLLKSQRTSVQITGDSETHMKKQKLFDELQRDASQGQFHFELGRIFLAEERFIEALKHFQKAIKFKEEQQYVLYFCLVVILKAIQNRRKISYRAYQLKSIEEKKNRDESAFAKEIFNKFTNICICFNPVNLLKKRNSHQDENSFGNYFDFDFNSAEKHLFYVYQKLLKFQEENPQNIDALWLLVQISIYFHNGEEKYQDFYFPNQIFECPQPPDYFASKLLQINQYYGSLAWTEIYLKYSFELTKSLEMIKNLQENYQTKPEGYLKLWDYYYYVENNYELALQIAEELYIKVSDSDLPNLNVIVGILYAKSLFKMNLYYSTFELLQCEFSRHSEHPIFLYAYGKYVAQSQQPNFYGSGLGALRECLRTSRWNQSKLKILYWIGEIHQLQNEKYQAYNRWLDCEELMQTERYLNSDKIYRVRKFLLENKYFDEINQLNHILRLPSIHPRVNYIYHEKKFSEFQMIDKFYSKFLHAKLQWKLKRNLDKVLQDLSNLSQEYPNKMESGFLLWEILKYQKNYEEMLKVSQQILRQADQCQVATNEWMKGQICHAKSLFFMNQTSKSLELLIELYGILPRYLLKSISYSGDFLSNKEQRGSTRYYNKKVENQSIIFSQVYQKSSSDASKRRTSNFYQINNLYSTLSMIKQNPINNLSRNSIIKNKVLRKSLKIRSAKKKQKTQFLSQKDIDFLKKIENLKRNLKEENEEKAQQDDTFQQKIQQFEQTEIFIKKASSFSVSSNIMFLYLIGKFAWKASIQLEDGLIALQDFINLIDYIQKDRKSEKFLKRIIKAKYYLGLLLIKLDDQQNGIQILKDIIFELHEFWEVDKFNHVKSILEKHQQMDSR